ncbi:MAG TPA: tripartite tricarboxylate transporter TctB family protein [Burkholderiales bacterium]|nr:tripartite tricarboxylate transporter TctB family protein [Burkholderiales bacterium]
MKLKISSPEDFWSGVMFIAFGALAIYVSRDYPMGSAMRMGPGYFPTAIGLCLIALGAAVTATGFKLKGEGIGRWPWRSMVVLSVGFATYAWGIDNLGFIPSLAILIGLVSVASRDYRWKEVIVSMAVLIAGSWAVFIYALGLPYPLFWWSY